MLDHAELHYILDPVAFARDLLRLQPDPLQAEVLASNARRGILCCTRQWGKSTIAAAKAVHEAFYFANSTILVAAPCERQSAELVRKCATILRTLIVHAGGPGLPFIGLLRTMPLNASLIKLNITGSGAPRNNNGIYQVTRAQLLTNLKLLFENRSLHILTDDLLLTELRGIQSSFRSEADHDHLVKATSLAACLSAEASAKAEEATKNWQAVLTPRAA